MKVVLDTMMWVSHATHADGPRAQTIDRSVRQRVRLFTSEYILAELERVLGQLQGLPRPFVRRTLRMIRRLATVVDLPASAKPFAVDDPDDAPVIQTALTGKADLIVTADKLLLELGKVRDVEIISLDEWLRRLPPEE
jgi:putative PIN family toxin of toxin-antitoxin system